MGVGLSHRGPPLPSLQRKSAGLVCGLALWLVAASAAAVDRIVVDAGAGNHVAVVGVSIGSPDWRRWAVSDDWRLGLHGKAGVALWEALDRDAQDRSIVAFSVYPVLRLERLAGSALLAYFEASLGINLLTHTQINDGRQLSTAFQFGEFAGAGVTFGDRQQYELGLRVQHVSNADIKKPNAGLSWGGVVFGYRFAAP
jgi:lipid A 3-O-deacylase